MLSSLFCNKFTKLSTKKVSKNLTGSNFFRYFSNQANKDYYKILGVAPDADKKQIKKAFAKMAQKYHPDRNKEPGAKERFRDIAEAYEVLNDPKKKEMYDLHGGDGSKSGAESGMGGGSGGQSYGGYDDFFAGEDFGDFFNDWMNMSNMDQPTRGRDVLLNIDITFQESIDGTKKQISFQRKAQCPTCKGTKCAPGTSPVTCNNCGGTGHSTVRQGNFQFAVVCPSCNGEGTIIRTPCKPCNGKGVKNSKTKETITIPKGIRNGQNLKIFEKGHTNDKGENPGELIIKVAVKADKYFKREDYDVNTDAFITVAQAVLGDELEVKTLSGSRKVKVPPGTHDGQRARLKGEGITKLPPNQHQKGDHVVTFRIDIPSRLTKEQKQIYEKLRNLEREYKE